MPGNGQYLLHRAFRRSAPFFFVPEALLYHILPCAFQEKSALDIIVDGCAQFVTILSRFETLK